MFPWQFSQGTYTWCVTGRLLTLLYQMIDVNNSDICIYCDGYYIVEQSSVMYMMNMWEKGSGVEGILEYL